MKVISDSKIDDVLESGFASGRCDGSFEIIGLVIVGAITFVSRERFVDHVYRVIFKGEQVEEDGEYVGAKPVWKMSASRSRMEYLSFGGEIGS